MKPIPLETYFLDTFQPQWLQSCPARVLQRFRRAVDTFALFHGQTPTLADLDDDKLERYVAWLVETKRAGRKKIDPAPRYAERLRQIRRHAIAGESRCRREMPVLDFFTDIYLKERPAKSESIGSYRSAVIRFGKFLGSQAMLSELNHTNVTLYLERLSPPLAKNHRGTLHAIWRAAFDLGYVTTSPEASPTPTRGAVTTQGDTLVHLMTSRYFPARLEITSEKTKRQYRYAMADFREFLGHEPTLADLDDETLTGFMRSCQERKPKPLAPKTINERAGRIRALWTWLARKSVVKMFPTFGTLREEARSPIAWTRQELANLFAACRKAKGTIGDARANVYYTALHMVLWNTGERIGAVRQIKRSWINREKSLLHIPAAARKGGRKEAWFQLWPETIAAIDKLCEEHEGEEVFPWDHSDTYFWIKYRNLLRRAGLPHDRKHSFHAMRRSFATWLNVSGGDDTKALGHSNSAITEKSYRDPRIVGAQEVNLFKPWEEMAKT